MEEDRRKQYRRHIDETLKSLLEEIEREAKSKTADPAPFGCSPTL